MLEVYIDFKCAGSYLALDPTLSLIEAADVPVTWHPFSTAERDMPSEGADADVIASHHKVREASKRAIYVKYARLRGMELEFPSQADSADLALGALAEIEGDRLPYIRACFAAYWEGHEDLDDAQVVSELLAACMACHSGDLSGAHARLQEAHSRAEEAGIVDAPAYQIAGQLFIGRQHLPWIAQLAAKR